jgi:hypothetical protein
MVELQWASVGMAIQEVFEAAARIALGRNCFGQRLASKVPVPTTMFISAYERDYYKSSNKA